MTKKKATRKKPDQQQFFEGEGFPKRPPKAVRDARDEFITAKREAAEAATHRGEREQILIDMMKKHGINRLMLEDENKFIEITAPEHATIKTIPKEQREKREKQAEE